MTRERIEDFREIVLPFVKKRLLETNYEGLGEADAKEFESDFNEILDLAIKALEQEPTIQERQAESDRWQKAFDDGYQNGYSQASFDCRQDFDKIRAEIETKYGQCKLTEYIVQYDGICTSTNDIGDIADILQIIDKHRAESEE